MKPLAHARSSNAGRSALVRVPHLCLAMFVLLWLLHVPLSACGEGLGERLHGSHNPTPNPSPRTGRGIASSASAQTDRRIDAINQLRAKLDQNIARSEAEPEYSNIYLTELAVNKDNGSYPAVGIYRPVVKFYYTYGDREKEPYPNRLLKIVVTVDRSDRKEQSEFVFNEAQQLVFYSEKKDDVDRRVYFVRTAAIRVEQNGRVLGLKDASRTAIVAAVLKDQTKFLRIFRDSLNL